MADSTNVVYRITQLSKGDEVIIWFRDQYVKGVFERYGQNGQVAVVIVHSQYTEFRTLEEVWRVTKRATDLVNRHTKLLKMEKRIQQELDKYNLKPKVI